MHVADVYGGFFFNKTIVKTRMARDDDYPYTDNVIFHFLINNLILKLHRTMYTNLFVI